MSMSHRDKWEKFYNPLKSDFWAEYSDGEYALLDIHLLTKEEIYDIRMATERIGRIFSKTNQMLRTAPDDTLWELDFDQETYHYLRMKTIEPESVISRVDWIKTPAGYKAMEINSDTPTFIKECFHINGLVCKEFDIRNPNEGMDRELSHAMRKAIMDSFKFNGGTGIPYVVFSSYYDHFEDRFTTEYLLKLSGLVNASYCPLHELKIDENGVYDSNDRKIDVLYRQTWPVEYLVHDENQETGIKIGQMLLDHIVNKKVAVINPPSAFLMQSKAVQVVIWGLHEEGVFYTNEEHRWIEQYMLPTYFEPDWFLEDKESYVKKPCFGREGDTVEIFGPDGSVIYGDSQMNYKDSAPVFQEFVELPKTTINTAEGKKDVHYMTGCFLISGKPSSIGIRAGKVVTDDNSYFLPVGEK